jgi:hypothetical protein
MLSPSFFFPVIPTINPTKLKTKPSPPAIIATGASQNKTTPMSAKTKPVTHNPFEPLSIIKDLVLRVLLIVPTPVYCLFSAYSDNTIYKKPGEDIARIGYLYFKKTTIFLTLLLLF